MAIKNGQLKIFGRHCGNQKLSGSFFLIANHVVTKSTFGHHA
jgi:hypothetical protein